MKESAAVKAKLLEEEPETSSRSAVAIGHQIESATSQGQGSSNPGSPEAVGFDVRSIVEQRFNRMNEAHDRIRSQELALRLAATEIKAGQVF